MILQSPSTTELVPAAAADEDQSSVKEVKVEVKVINGEGPGSGQFSSKSSDTSDDLADPWDIVEQEDTSKKWHGL